MTPFFFSRRSLVAGGLASCVAVLLSACATQEQATGMNAAAGSNQYYQAAFDEAKKIASGQQLAPTLTMLGANSGPEGQSLQAVYEAFTDATGVKINYTGSNDVLTLVKSRVDAGNAPDVADIPLGTALDYAKAGKINDLSAAFGEDLKKNYSPSLLEDASFAGKVFGVYQGFSNFMLWYNPQTYTGPKDPTSWNQIEDWTKAEASKGNAVWCAAQNAGGASGFPGAQFLENIFLKENGPDLYKQWGEGKLPWTSPQVKGAFQKFSSLVGNNQNVAGGINGILSAQIASGYNGLVSSPGTCQVALWGSWVPGLIGSSARPGENLDFYKVPASNPQFENAELFQSTVSVGFSDNATTKAFLRFMASTPAQTYLASQGRWTVANTNVPSSAYPNAVLQKISKTYFGTSQTQLAVGPNVLADSATQTAYWKGVMTYLQDPAQLDSVLQTIQDTVK